MECPVCGKEMKERDLGGVVVDVCENGCKGMWFDWFELGKLDENNEGCGRALQEALRYPAENDENRQKINCPKCGLPMHIHKYRSSKEVNVDECYNCGGFFLDSGELKLIRDTFMSEEEREAYAQKLIDDIPEHKQAVEDQEKEKARVAAIKNLTKFIRFSYYMTGK